MVISMKDFGASLGTRVAGRSAYDDIMTKSGQLTEPVVFDFSGVTTITNSFADEVFGRMVSEIGMVEMRARTSFRGVDPFWARIIRSAMDRRESSRETVTA